MTQLKALIFDVDGTLANTERDGHRLAFNCAFTEAGLDWHWSIDLYGKLLAVSGGKERLKFYLEQYQPQFQPQNISELISNLHQLKTKYYQELLIQGSIPLRPGVKRLIRAAREENLRLAIATTSALPNAMALLEKTLSPQWFEIIAAGDIVAAKKPAPDIYDYVLAHLNLSAANCLAIEDSVHGLQAATTAGIKTIVTVNDYTQNQDFSRASLVLSDLGEPEQPMEVIQGSCVNNHYLDLASLRSLV